MSKDVLTREAVLQGLRNYRAEFERLYGGFRSDFCLSKSLVIHS